MRIGAIEHFQTGVAVPVFSLRTPRSCGTGEFADLVALAQWCSAVGIDIIQTLPVNDTGPDRSPYNAQSAFALNPLFLRLDEIPGAHAFEAEIAQARSRFNAAPALDYTAVRQFKDGMLERIYRASNTAQTDDPAFDRWLESQAWIKPYCVFRVLKESNEHRAWYDWNQLRNPSPAEIEDYFATHADRTRLFAWIQFHLERQFREATIAAEALGVRLKGDIPILVSEDSADVWAHRSYFNSAMRAGAPPDMFSEAGQNWRFPSFDWDALERDGYSWWRARLEHASRFYHAVRIDHVLGFFRLWVIPEAEFDGRSGQFNPAVPLAEERLSKEGFTAIQIAELLDAEVLMPSMSGRGFVASWYFFRNPVFEALPAVLQARFKAILDENYRQQDPLWRAHGRKLLRMLCESSDMLVCAEDLGVVPQCVPEVLRELDILSLKIERWTREYGKPAEPFIHPRKYPRLSVCSPSTHDTSGLRGWWEENWDHAPYLQALGRESELPAELTPGLALAIVRRNLEANSLLCIIPLQDYFAVTAHLRSESARSERINVPGTPPSENWSYRTPDLAVLLEDEAFNRLVAALVAERRNRPLVE